MFIFNFNYFADLISSNLLKVVMAVIILFVRWIEGSSSSAQ